MFADFLKNLTMPKPEPMDDADTHLALAALLVRLARSDGYYAANEIIRIEKILQLRFGISQDSAAEMRGRAEQLEEEAPDTVRFTRALKDTVPYEERTGILELLWQVALADGERDAEEDALIRLVVKLLGISDRDSVRARHKVSAAR